ncbi:MAG: hypothetical protein JST83_08925 [Bacteroidetes bacterium]|nr:hypothetical protein [Bacteroidota bacterium]
MIRIALLSLLLSATGICAGHGAQAVPQRVTGVVSVTFPTVPRATRVADQQNYLVQTDTCAWLAQAKPYIDSGQVHDSATLASFYNGMAKGILRAAKGAETRRNSVTIDGLKALEIEYVKGDNRSLPATVCSRALKVNGQIVIISFTAPTELYGKMTATRDKFFASITLDKDSMPESYPASDQAPKDSGQTAVATASATDTSAVHMAAPAPTPFMRSHAGSVLKMFGLLILVCALIYAFAVYTRRNG